jgi:hypothetical protein
LLLASAGHALSEGPAELEDVQRLAGDVSAGELGELLGARNGFFAYGRALHVFPAGASSGSTGVSGWNSRELWKACYGGLADGCLFFAQDALARQYCLRHREVLSFDPETGALESVAPSLREWAGLVVDDPDSFSARRLLSAWEAQHGPLTVHERLFPKYPFVLGGAFDLTNLRAMDAVAGLRFFGELAVQLHTLPEGTRVEFRIRE